MSHLDAPALRNDLVLRGGLVVDGTGDEPRRADVVVRSGLVTDVGTDVRAGSGAHDVDCTGLVVAPGFIDIHTHSDVSVIHDPTSQSKVLQGVTTEVVGNCSFSAFPIADDRRQLHCDHMARLGDEPILPLWDDLAGYARRIHSSPPALNVAPLIGHGTVRIAVMGVADRAPSSDELQRMTQLVDDELANGAFGFTTGLTHVPSSYGSTDEVEHLLTIVARRGALYATHARATAGNEFGAVDEAVEMARRTGVRLQYSHVALNEPTNWGRAAEYLGLFDAAVDEGLDVAFDLYPYDASCSSLTQYLPGWLQAGGSDELRRRLADRSAHHRALTELRRGWYGGIPWLWDRVRVARCPDSALSGQTLDAIAAQRGADPAELVLELCAKFGNEIEVVMFYRTESDMISFLRHPLTSIGSDGSAIPLDQHGRSPHPRHFGTFPRVLGRYVRDQAALDLPEAIRKMTSAPADRMQLHGRGRVVPGSIADLVAFDPDNVRDLATFADPCRSPEGITHVWVGGHPVVTAGAETGLRPGRVLRRHARSQ